MKCLVIYLTFNMSSLKSVRNSACLLCMWTLVLYLATQSPSAQCPLKLSSVDPTWWNLLKRNLRGAVSPDCQVIQYRGQLLSLAAGNSISDFDGNDACLFPQPCQLLNCAEPAGQICRDSLSSSSAFYGNAAGYARSLPRGGLEGEMTCPPIWQLISNKKAGLTDQMHRERAWELPLRFTKKSLKALLGVKVLMPLPVVRFQCCSVAKSCPTLQPHRLQHARLPCPSLSVKGSCSNSCSLSQSCHPIILSSIVPFSSCPQSFPVLGSFPLSCLFASGHQSIGASASASALPMNIQHWFPLGLTGLISLIISIS